MKEVETLRCPPIDFSKTAIEKEGIERRNQRATEQSKAQVKVDIAVEKIKWLEGRDMQTSMWMLEVCLLRFQNLSDASASALDVETFFGLGACVDWVLLELQKDKLGALDGYRDGGHCIYGLQKQI